MKRVLHVVGYLGRGGDTTAVMNISNYVCKKKYDYQFDYLTHDGCNLNLVDKLRKQGSKVYILHGDVRKLGIIRYYKEIKNILVNNKYDCVHFHTSFQSFVGLFAAKRCTVGLRICHSHTTKIQRNINVFLKKTGLFICRILINHFSTHCVACSDVAGKFLFGNNKNYEVIHNGIDIDNFRKVNNYDVKKIVDMYHLSDKIVIGQVGVFNSNKNQMFTIELAEKLDKSKYFFFLIGEGNDREKIIDYCREKKLNNIIFTNWIDNVNDYMSIFDYLLLPSKYGEGLPTVLIEEQVLNNRCLCISSDIVTKEANLGNVIFLKLNSDEWKEIITSSSSKEFNKISIDDFDINVSGENWLNLYK